MKDKNEYKRLIRIVRISVIYLERWWFSEWGFFGSVFQELEFANEFNLDFEAYLNKKHVFDEFRKKYFLGEEK